MSGIDMELMSGIGFMPNHMSRANLRISSFLRQTFAYRKINLPRSYSVLNNVSTWKFQNTCKQNSDTESVALLQRCKSS
jgi:hypothetical protein